MVPVDRLIFARALRLPFWLVPGKIVLQKVNCDLGRKAKHYAKETVQIDINGYTEADSEVIPGFWVPNPNVVVGEPFSVGFFLENTLDFPVFLSKAPSTSPTGVTTIFRRSGKAISSFPIVLPPASHTKFEVEFMFDLAMDAALTQVKLVFAPGISKQLNFHFKNIPPACVGAWLAIDLGTSSHVLAAFDSIRNKWYCYHRFGDHTQSEGPMLDEKMWVRLIEGSAMSQTDGSFEFETDKDIIDRFNEEHNGALISGMKSRFLGPIRDNEYQDGPTGSFHIPRLGPLKLTLNLLGRKAGEMGLSLPRVVCPVPNNLPILRRRELTASLREVWPKTSIFADIDEGIAAAFSTILETILDLTKKRRQERVITHVDMGKSTSDIAQIQLLPGSEGITIEILGHSTVCIAGETITKALEQVLLQQAQNALEVCYTAGSTRNSQENSKVKGKTDLGNLPVDDALTTDLLGKLPHVPKLIPASVVTKDGGLAFKDLAERTKIKMSAQSDSDNSAPGQTLDENAIDYKRLARDLVETLRIVLEDTGSDTGKKRYVKPASSMFDSISIEPKQVLEKIQGTLEKLTREIAMCSSLDYVQVAEAKPHILSLSGRAVFFPGLAEFIHKSVCDKLDVSSNDVELKMEKNPALSKTAVVRGAIQYHEFLESPSDYKINTLEFESVKCRYPVFVKGSQDYDLVLPRLTLPFSTASLGWKKDKPDVVGQKLSIPLFARFDSREGKPDHIGAHVQIKVQDPGFLLWTEAEYDYNVWIDDEHRLWGGVFKKAPLPGTKAPVSPYFRTLADLVEDENLRNAIRALDNSVSTHLVPRSEGKLEGMEAFRLLVSRQPEAIDLLLNLFNEKFVRETDNHIEILGNPGPPGWVLVPIPKSVMRNIKKSADLWLLAVKHAERLGWILRYREDEKGRRSYVLPSAESTDYSTDAVQRAYLPLILELDDKKWTQHFIWELEKGQQGSKPKPNTVLVHYYEGKYGWSPTVKGRDANGKMED